MKEYKVVVIESGSLAVSLMAESEEEAIGMIRDLYDSGGLEVYSDVEFECITL